VIFLRFSTRTSICSPSAFCKILRRYSEKNLSELFCGPLLRWMRKTIAPLKYPIPGKDFALKIVNEWRTQLAKLVRNGVEVQCPKSSRQDSLADRAVAEMSKSCLKMKHKCKDGDNSSSAYSDGSSSSSSSSSDDDDSGSYKRTFPNVTVRRQRRRSASLEATPSHVELISRQRVLSDREGNQRKGRFFSDIRSVVLWILCLHVSDAEFAAGSTLVLMTCRSGKNLLGQIWLN
jgi:hypothetical protein